MNRSLLVKLFGSLTAIMLITACNGQTEEEDKKEQEQTEESEETMTEETPAEEETTEEETKEEGQ
ncbi:hypothetical protein FZC66_11755 [Priestia megaterium]|nr:hypothetical protein FZC66_11755 [Priestia megaterium]